MTVEMLSRLAAGLSGFTAGLAAVGLLAYANAPRRTLLSHAVAGLLLAWASSNLVIFILFFLKVRAALPVFVLVWILAQVLGIASIAVNLYAWNRVRRERRKERT